MRSFGQMLRFHRRQCHDDLRGGLLTQERLGELIGHELGDAGYTGAAVSDWERDKSSIGKDDRHGSGQPGDRTSQARRTAHGG